MEKRASIRRHLIFYLRVFDRESNELLGFLGDINADGMLLISEHEMAPGDHLKVRMQFPKPLGDSEHLNLDATIRWCNPDVNKKFYDIGMEFDHPSDQDLAIFGDLLKEFGFKH